VQKNKEMFDKIKNYFSLTADELINKVSWPSWDELRESSIIVLAASVVFAILVYFGDLGINFILKMFYGFFK
jgi:preprotein translocase subunit SecE